MKINVGKHVEEFNNKTHNINYMRHGVFKSELYIIFCLYRELGCNFFIESGLCNGVSTNTLLALISDDYIGIDMDEACQAAKIDKPNFHFIHGRTEERIFELVRSDKQIFIFIDGPKGQMAIDLKNQLLELDNVKTVAIHDTYDGIEHDTHMRVFETKSNEEYNKKYFEILNQKNESKVATIYNTDIYDTIDGQVVYRNYNEWYPTGPGLSVYSKAPLQPII